MKTKITLFLLTILNCIFINAQEKNQSDWAYLEKYREANQEQKKMKNNVVLMGDSITEFWKSNDSTFFETNGLINRGISSQTTSQMLVRFQQDVIDLKPKAVVILAGINDIAENTGPITLEAIFNNIKTMVEMAQKNEISVILCSVLPSNHFYWNPKILPADKVISLNQMIQNYAEKNHITYIDYYSKMVDTEKGLLQKYGEDGVHPNPTGYDLMETLLLQSL